MSWPTVIVPNMYCGIWLLAFENDSVKNHRTCIRQLSPLEDLIIAQNLASKGSKHLLSSKSNANGAKSI